MSIQSTSTVGRNFAIARITEVNDLATRKKYRDLDSVCSEHDHSLQEFVDGYRPMDVSNLEDWTNVMLADKLDEPFFRQSIYDNYIVTEKEED